MSKVSGIMEKTEEVAGKPATLVRRVSNLLKDGNHSGPPMLFRHAPMQKIRHCCQNLNLLPYLLYSFDNSKSHPVARKVHLCLGQLLRLITARIFFLYKSFRHSLLRGIHRDEFQPSNETTIGSATGETSKRRSVRFQSKCQPSKRKQNNPLYLILAVYLAPLLLAFQLVGLFSLMIFGKYTPGFIFLISALLFLGCISLKIMHHDSEAYANNKAEKMKVQ